MGSCRHAKLHALIKKKLMKLKYSLYILIKAFKISKITQCVFRINKIRNILLYSSNFPGYRFLILSINSSTYSFNSNSTRTPLYVLRLNTEVGYPVNI